MQQKTYSGYIVLVNIKLTLFAALTRLQCFCRIRGCYRRCPAVGNCNIVDCTYIKELPRLAAIASVARRL